MMWVGQYKWCDAKDRDCVMLTKEISSRMGVLHKIVAKYDNQSRW